VTSSRDTSPRRLGALASRIVALAGTPDDDSGIDFQLAAIAQLAADTLPPVSYASVTAVRDSSNTTVAASSDLAVAVDHAQYAEDSGPCLQALAEDTPVRVDDIAATMTWPGFRAAAAELGLHASLSVPLFAGSGATTAVLNLYGHDPVTMIALSARVWAVYQADPAPAPVPGMPPADAGGDDLIAGLTEAFRIRALIERAKGVVIARRGCSVEDAYLDLRFRAAEAGTGLADVATALLRSEVPRPRSEPDA
jgi:hypothetical protein